MSKVSVVIPAHNVAVCVSRAIQSVLAQEGHDLEVIVVDDGSTDDTVRVTESFGDQIRLVQQENQGQGAARNVGLTIATGDYVAFLDADDYWLPGFLNATVGFLVQHSDVVAVSTGQRNQLWGKKPYVWPRLLNTADCPSGPVVLPDFFRFWGEHDHIRTGSAVIRRDVIAQAGLQRPDLRISQDLEYWAYIATFGKWGFIPEVYLVCDPMPAAKKVGWLTRYQKRRKLCPTVESWQQRIVPRLQPADMEGFRQARGRVALCYAQSKILAGDLDGAYAIVSEYGHEMPSCSTRKIMLSGRRWGKFSQRIASLVIRGKETFKAALMRVS